MDPVRRVWHLKFCVVLVAQSCPTLWDPHGLQPATLLCPWDSPGKNTGVGCHALLQGIFPTQGSNPGLQHHRQILYSLSYPGNPNPHEGQNTSPNRTPGNCGSGLTQTLVISQARGSPLKRKHRPATVSVSRELFLKKKKKKKAQWTEQESITELSKGQS